MSDDTFVYFVTDDVPNPGSRIDTGSGADVLIAGWGSFLTTSANDISERSPSAWDHHPAGYRPGEPPPG